MEERGREDGRAEHATYWKLRRGTHDKELSYIGTEAMRGSFQLFLIREDEIFVRSRSSGDRKVALKRQNVNAKRGHSNRDRENSYLQIKIPQFAGHFDFV